MSVCDAGGEEGEHGGDFVGGDVCGGDDAAEVGEPLGLGVVVGGVEGRVVEGGGGVGKEGGVICDAVDTLMGGP